MRRVSTIICAITTAILCNVTSSTFAQSQYNAESTLSPVSVTIAKVKPKNENKPKDNKQKYDIKVTSTTDFEEKHLAKDKEDAEKKAHNRKDGGDLLHYMRRTDISGFHEAFKRKFAKELSEEDFKTPKPDIEPNNYWVGEKFPVWEYDKRTGKLSEKKVDLCLGLINFRVNPNTKTVEIALHHIQQVR